MPQVGANATIYIPVDSVEEAYKVMQILAAYDQFQFTKNIKPDFCNTGGLQMWDEDAQDWNDWDFEDDSDYFDDVDEYCENKSDQRDHLDAFRKQLWNGYNKIEFEF